MEDGSIKKQCIFAFIVGQISGNSNHGNKSYLEDWQGWLQCNYSPRKIKSHVCELWERVHLQGWVQRFIPTHHCLPSLICISIWQLVDSSLGKKNPHVTKAFRASREICSLIVNCIKIWTRCVTADQKPAQLACLLKYFKIYLNY